MPGAYLVDKTGTPIDSSNPLPTTATINVGDIEIGAVEIKDGTTDTRAVVDATYGLKVDVSRLVAVTPSAVNPTAQTATIANGASLSDAIDLAGRTLLGIHMPAAWTTANLTFKVSEDGVTYSDMYDNLGTEKNTAAAADRYIFTTPSDWVGVRFVEVRSGTSGTPVTQGAARSIVLISKVV